MFMKAELSQPTLGLLRRILEEMQPEDTLIQEEAIKFWKDALFDFGFAPATIDLAASYGFKWGDIISDLFVGRFGHQNAWLSNAISPYLCEQTLKRLAAFGLFHSRGTATGDEFRQSLNEDGFDLKSDLNNELSVPVDVQQKLNSPFSSVELEITRCVLDRFLNLHDSTLHKPLIIKFKAPDALERLVRSSIIKVHDQQHYLPLALAFHYSGNTVALERAKKSVEITLHVLRKAYEVEPDKPESHFTVKEIEARARMMYDDLEPDTLKLGLYLAKEFSNVLAGYGGNTQGTEVDFVRIHERIVTLDISTAWDDHIRLRSKYIEQEELQRKIAKMPPMRSAVTMPSANPSVMVLISHSSKDKVLAEALIELLRSALGLLPNQIRCTSVDGYRLPAGVNTDDQLRAEIKSVAVLIGLLTPNSLSSTYVLFELGARWGAGLFMISLLAGIAPESMQGPHRVLNALSCETEGQLVQLVEDIAKQLKIEPQSASAYLKQVSVVKSLAEKIQPSSVTQLSELQADNIKLKSPLAASEEMEPSGPHNYFYRNGKTDGPYCPTCWQKDGKRILLPASADYAAGKGKKCTVCKELYIEEPRKRGPAISTGSVWS